jgi:formylglycine-generating enzyme required for sulfatase activity
MKKLLLIGFAGAMIASCTQRTGHLTGVSGRPIYQPEEPLGMVYIPSGGFQMGENDQDVPFMHQTRAKTVSVQAFYIDNTEISNNEYRQFVNWVRDSIAREIVYVNPQDRKSGYDNADWTDEDADRFINYEEFFFDETDISEPYKSYDENYLSDRQGNRGGYSSEFGATDASAVRFSLNWDRRLDYSDPEIVPLLADMYLPQQERFYGRREIDTRKLMFRYFWIDYREAAQRGRINRSSWGQGYDAAPSTQSPDSKTDEDHRSLILPRNPITLEAQTEAEDFVGSGQEKDLGYFNKKGQNNAIRGHDNRKRFVIDEVINVYPDTLCWVRDFTYSFHDPMTNMYFWHPAYDNYPVVGVTWVQAKAFSVWRTQLLNNWLTAMGEMFVNDFRLPTEAEWERAARGDMEMSQYPWGGPYIRNENGCFLGNFKPMRGRYFEDGGFHTVKVFSYSPNAFGLYCMAGNVAEWCETAYHESMYEFSHDMNPDYRYDALDWDTPAMKRKIIRGGSWKDVGYYLMNATRTYEFQDTAKSYIGFRNVMTHLGRGGKDFTNEGSEDIRSDIQLR